MNLERNSYSRLLHNRQVRLAKHKEMEARQ